MESRRLNLLVVSRLPPSPPRFGAQVRIHGLASALAVRHDVTVAALLPPGMDGDEARRAVGAWARRVVLVPGHPGHEGRAKRWLQLRSLASRWSYEHLLHAVPALQAALDDLLRATAFDVVDVEFPFMTRLALRQAPPGRTTPRVVLDEHNVEWDLQRQVSARETGLVRRLYGAANWRKLRAEEQAAWSAYDGVTVCSSEDQARVLAAAPGARAAVIPNAVDPDVYYPRPPEPGAPADTVVFFGSQAYAPNADGILHFLDHIWPRLLAQRPAARLRIIGPGAPPAVLARRAANVEVAGFVEDLRPHLAGASAIIAPLRLGGGTRLKILEALAMGLPVVSTRLGAEGLAARDGVELLLADEPADFAAAVVRVLEDRALAARLGQSARALVERRYSWKAAAQAWEAFALGLPSRPGR